MVTTSNPSLKPILKWVGGKRQLLDAILPLIPEGIDTYVEPFVGGAAVLLATAPEKAIVNDANAELINVYRVVRDDPDGLLRLLREHEALNSADHFYEVRALDREAGFATLSATVRAARIIYLNKTCYNGLYRVNASGQLNVPYGRYRHPDIVNEVGVRALSAYLGGAVDIRCGDYEDVLERLSKGTFVYLDPPYMPVSKTASFTGYTQGGFGYEEQVRLRDACARLRDDGVRFLQSNSDCEEVRELYEGFTIRPVKARRSVNSRGSGRGAVGEVLISG